MDLARFRTSRDKIEPKTHGTIRLLLIGESAAGSFGYWGSFNLATEIQRQLSLALGRQDIEVIDLSCVNASWYDCNEILNASITLDPDGVIFYAGNNEIKGLLQYLQCGQTLFDDSALLAARWAWLSAGEAVASSSLLHSLTVHCEKLLQETISIARGYEVPLLYVVPGLNMLDWRPLERQAWSMPEVSPSSRLLGLGSQAQKWSLAREEYASDSREDKLSIIQTILESQLGTYLYPVPQCLPSVSAQLEIICEKEGVEFFSMPRALGPGDRRTFTDYCHLAPHGIHATASGIVSKLSGGRLEAPEDSVDDRIRMMTQLETFQGAIVAMLHNYHYGQTDALVEHWCSCALASGWSRATVFLNTLRRVVVSRSRASLTEPRLSELGLIDSDWDARFNLYIAKFVYHARFDLRLAEVVGKVLRAFCQTEAEVVLSDPRLEQDGSLYSLYYLDHLRGFRPLSRSANRNGWEREELDIVLDCPTASVQFPSLERDVRAIWLHLEFPDEVYFSVIVNGRTVASQLRGIEGWHEYEVALNDVDFSAGPNTIVLCADRMYAASGQSEMRHYFHGLRFGQYPTWGRVENIALRFKVPDQH
ncbi:hypothetical protein [Ideonella sp. B508-1]|uniref:hypothetical protein n=1 Tax=Ideonella sp. B508-1 TaxID=137716 RepID=UPI0011D24720|nr:hypothetical protein [Ideonella sp. B508-1]